MTITDGAPHPEIILELLGEGSSLTLVGIKVANGWRFRTIRDERTYFDLLDEEDREGINFYKESDWVESWESALALFDKYPWHWLVPRQVHRDFSEQIWAALQRRCAADKGEAARRRDLKRWYRLWDQICAALQRRCAADKGETARRRDLERWYRLCHGEAQSASEGNVMRFDIK